ncbi:ABC transporter permease [Desulfosporosinus sp. FKA]|uniref:ABC transporter permease n=1 Tax=Desulfosporosinus sp. FKA TaxID=1969834 RepID=UPI001551981A|nr:ABC transporter permease [Desulfosporosinus sp. FKA]
MVCYILRRLSMLFLVLVIVAILAFFCVYAMPGDPVRIILGDFATKDQILQLRHQLGLDQSVYVRFFIWLSRIIHGDFGESLFLHMPVSKAILSRMEPTLLLAVMGQLIGIILGVPIGVIAAVKHRTWMDRFAVAFSLAGISIPSFWLALILILFFGVYLGWFPVCGYKPISEVGFGVIKYLILPGLTLGLMQSGLIARMTRSSMLEVLGQDYIRTAKAKGLMEYVIIMRHALKNACIPVVTIIGMSFGLLLGGTWIVETIYYIPGTGALAITAIMKRDFPVIQGTMIFTALIFVVVNLLADISYVLLNPRIKN